MGCSLVTIYGGNKKGDSTMGFSQKLAAGVKKHMGNLRKAYDNQMAVADARARADMAKTKTKADREKVKAKLAQEKLAIQRELYEAQAATKKAKVALEKAKREAGDLSMGERFEQSLRSTYRGVMGGKTTKRRATTPSKPRAARTRKITTPKRRKKS